MLVLPDYQPVIHSKLWLLNPAVLVVDTLVVESILVVKLQVSLLQVFNGDSASARSMAPVPVQTSATPKTAALGVLERCVFRARFGKSMKFQVGKLF